MPPRAIAALPFTSVKRPDSGALRKHIEKLSGDEKEAFLRASKEITESTLLHNIKTLDDAHKDSSKLRKHAEPLAKFLNLLDRFLGGVTIGIQQSPDISSLVIGGVRLVIDLARNFVSFFDRLSEMLYQFSDFLGPLAEYAKSAGENPLIRDALSAIYGDILEFFGHARCVFID
ncbi:uncharacterized protein K452DRAFT_260720, partial [Aplosporella prunicola CBS 121167]